MQASIQLIVGLGNPGPQYAETRHNVGIWFVQELARLYGAKLKESIKFKGFYGLVKTHNCACHLLIPTTYMNLSGQSVKALAEFYKIQPQAILVVHDELDFAPGIVRLKYEGGHGGHNGLRDIIRQLNSNAFYRLRLGIGHPGHRDLVSDYVLSRPSAEDRDCINQAITRVLDDSTHLLGGEIGHLMQALHQL